jgi:5'-nucleotidase
MNVAENGDYHFDTAARFAKTLAQNILNQDMPDGTFLNVNVPNKPWEEIQGIVITRLGQRVYHDRIIRRVDPQGREYFWIGGEAPTWVKAEGTDFHALEEDKISVTPLGADFTQFHAIPELDRWNLPLE